MRWRTFQEMAAELNVSVRTLQRRAKNPEKWGLVIRRKPPEQGSRSRILLALATETASKTPDSEPDQASNIVAIRESGEKKPDKSPAADAANMDDMPLDYQFEYYLHKKLLGKTGSNRRQQRKYYTDQYKKTGEIPPGLKAPDGRTVANRLRKSRKPSVDSEVEKRFVEMVRAAALSGPEDPAFITRRLRKVTNFHSRLEAEFGRKLPIQALYRVKKREKLCWLFKKPDYEMADTKKETYFNPEPVFGLVQMDGVILKYIELRDGNGNWRHPVAIEFFDTGSRYLMAMDVYFGESNENSVDIFCNFLTAHPFPRKRVRIRPDNAKGFQNLKRPIHHLNLKYSVPDGFMLDADYARAYAPKQKVHLESSHRCVHNFEERIIDHLSGRIAGRRRGNKFFGGKMEAATVTRLDMTIEEFRATGLIEKYRLEHNARKHRFSEGGENVMWSPGEKFRAYLKAEVGDNGVTFSEEDTRIFRAYGYPKQKATVRKNGVLQYQNRQYQAVEGEFRGSSSTPVRVSHVDGKLYIFEPKPDGLLIGEAMAIGASEMPKFVEKRVQKRLGQNGFELIAAQLEKSGMTIDNDRLLQLYKSGMTLRAATDVMEINRAKYAKYGGFIAFNLFITDWTKYNDQGGEIAPYADLGR